MLLDSLILTAVGECFGAPHRIRPPAGGSSAPRTSARMLFRPLLGLPRPSEVLLGLTVGRGGDPGDLYSRRLLSAWSSDRSSSMSGAPNFSGPNFCRHGAPENRSPKPAHSSEASYPPGRADARCRLSLNLTEFVSHHEREILDSIQVIRYWWFHFIFPFLPGLKAHNSLTHRVQRQLHHLHDMLRASS